MDWAHEIETQRRAFEVWRRAALIVLHEDDREIVFDEGGSARPSGRTAPLARLPLTASPRATCPGTPSSYDPCF